MFAARFSSGEPTDCLIRSLSESRDSRPMVIPAAMAAQHTQPSAANK
jgi:hypothetical protein